MLAIANLLQVRCCGFFVTQAIGNKTCRLLIWPDTCVLHSCFCQAVLGQPQKEAGIQNPKVLSSAPTVIPVYPAIAACTALWLSEEQ